VLKRGRGLPVGPSTSSCSSRAVWGDTKRPPRLASNEQFSSYSGSFFMHCLPLFQRLFALPFHLLPLLRGELHVGGAAARGDPGCMKQGIDPGWGPIQLASTLLLLHSLWPRRRNLVTDTSIHRRYSNSSVPLVLRIGGLRHRRCRAGLGAPNWVPCLHPWPVHWTSIHVRRHGELWRCHRAVPRVSRQPCLRDVHVVTFAV